MQLTLALGPTVTVQVVPLLHAREQDWPQLPMQLFLSLHVAVQLPPLQPPCDKSQLAPDGQAQLVPVHDGACADPQPTIPSSANPTTDIIKSLKVFIVPPFDRVGRHKQHRG